MSFFCRNKAILFFCGLIMWMNIFISSLAATLPASIQAGERNYSFLDKVMNKQINVVVWYPALPTANLTPTNDIWERTQIAFNSAINTNVPTAKNGKLPLILFSHGYKGSPASLSWFAITLAKKGYIVVAPQHQDSGPLPLKPYMEHWHRAIDISFVLSELEKLPLNKVIDINRIGMAGYSIGTSTGLWLAGGIASTYERTLNPGRQFAPEEEFPSIDSAMYNYLHDHTDFKAAKKRYRDPRIKAVFLMAPGYGWAFDNINLSKITIPVFIVAAEKDEMLYPETNAYYFSKYIPYSSMKVLPNVGHFIFINGLTQNPLQQFNQGDVKHIESINALGIFRYTPEERNKMHQLIGELAISFFGKNL